MVKGINILRQFIGQFQKFRNLKGFVWKSIIFNSNWQELFLLILGGSRNRYFLDKRLKSDRLPDFNMLFQFLPTEFSKAKCFSCLQ